MLISPGVLMCEKQKQIIKEGKSKMTKVKCMLYVHETEPSKRYNKIGYNGDDFFAPYKIRRVVTNEKNFV